MAEAAQIEIAPHTWGNGIGLLANLHLAASMPNCRMLEFPTIRRAGSRSPAATECWPSPSPIDADGAVSVPDAPGFGFASTKSGSRAIRVCELSD